MRDIAYIGMGSNIGDGCDNCLQSARNVLLDGHTQGLAISSFYRTSPVSPIPQPHFINGVLKIAWQGTPLELLQHLLDTELKMGRQRTVHLGPRNIDLDILLFGATIMDTPELILPHPRLHERKFTLLPLIEIDPDLVHPLLHRRLADMLDEIDDTQSIELFRRASDEELQTLGIERCI